METLVETAVADILLPEWHNSGRKYDLKAVFLRSNGITSIHNVALYAESLLVRPEGHLAVVVSSVVSHK